MGVVLWVWHCGCVYSCCLLDAMFPIGQVLVGKAMVSAMDKTSTEIIPSSTNWNGEHT